MGDSAESRKWLNRRTGSSGIDCFSYAACFTIFPSKAESIEVLLDDDFSFATRIFFAKPSFLKVQIAIQVISISMGRRPCLADFGKAW